MRSGELLGRTLFLRTSIQFLLIPAVMADNVNTASRVCQDKEIKEITGEENREGRWSPDEEGKWEEGWGRGLVVEWIFEKKEGLLNKRKNNYIYQSVILKTLFILHDSTHRTVLQAS